MTKQHEDKSIFLALVFHFHQPVDNFEWVLEDCFKKAYQPLIEHLFNFPEIKATLHFSGNILDWFIKEKPRIINMLKMMTSREQIELIGGGYYEPIFAIIPHEDRIAQIDKLIQFIESEFHTIVKGAWLSERVWEPNYPSFLNDLGLKYVIVDDNHFRSAGIAQDDTFYTYITEDEGKSLTIFPINEELRYLTPWKPTYLSIDYLREKADKKGDRIAVLISDAEKMGVWGTTHQICYVPGQGHQDGDNGKPFIPAFFDQILNNRWIKSLKLSEYMEQFSAKSLIYLPTASYDKMEEWVLPTPIRKKFEKLREELKDNPAKQFEYLFLHGGFWRYFLVKYPESNNMHKKMLYVRNKLLQFEESVKSVSISSQQKESFRNAWDELYKSQCNDCYWHGLFGGVYLQFLRFAVYTHLINIERLIDGVSIDLLNHSKNYISILSMDFNKDSKLELIIESNVLNLYINPGDGGTVIELDYKPKSYNLLNTLTRWREAYHEDEEIASYKVKVDRFRRSMFRTRVFQGNVSLKMMETDNYLELADFASADYKVIRNEKEGSTARIEMECIGTIKDEKSNIDIPYKCQKKLIVNESNIDFTITTKLLDANLKKYLNGLYLGVDLPFFFNGNPKSFTWQSNDMKADQKVHLIESFEYEGTHFKAVDGTYNLNLEVNIRSGSKKVASPVEILRFPLITHAFTDEGYKEIYQGINLMVKTKLDHENRVNININVQEEE
jgi:hypothetical protein